MAAREGSTLYAGDDLIGDGTYYVGDTIIDSDNFWILPIDQTLNSDAIRNVTATHQCTG